MCSYQQQSLDEGNVVKFKICQNESLLSVKQVLRAWQSDQRFCYFFGRLLAQAKFAAYFWELPAISNSTLDNDFECVLVNHMPLAEVESEPAAFSDYFAEGEQVVSFENLGKDALLIVPLPVDVFSDFTHLAAFSRNAEASQQCLFWKSVGETIEQNLTDKPLWVSTSGLGVYWLHVRLDKRPKYYSYLPYKNCH